MFTDPQILVVNAVSKSLPRIKNDGTSAIYSFVDGAFVLTISHQKSKLRVRSLVRTDERAVVPDPLTSVNDYETLSIQTVIDRPEVGFSILTVQQLMAAHTAWLDSAAVAKLYGTES